MAAIDPLTAGAVLLATAATDAVYVMFTSAVVARKRVPAATWSSVWYLLSSYAVISYTENWVYVAFAAVGSWLGAYRIDHLSAPAARRPAGRGGAGMISNRDACHGRSRVCFRLPCRSHACVAEGAGGEASWWSMATSSVCTGDVRSLNASIGFASVRRLRRVSRRMR